MLHSFFWITSFSCTFLMAFIKDNVADQCCQHAHAHLEKITTGLVERKLQVLASLQD